MSQQRLLTPREAAAYLRLNPRTVTRLAREGKLPAVRVGKRWRFRMDALDDWSQHREEEAGEIGFSRGQDITEAAPLASLLRPELVICDLKATDKRGALEEIVSGLVEAGALREKQLFLNLLLEREELMSTNIVEGVAVPHPRRAVEGMFERSHLCVAISRRGVNFSDSGGVVVRVFFVICASDDRWHLRILARISRLLLETPVVERVLGATFPEEVIKTVAAQEEALRGDGGLIAG